ncbi:MAG: hypothetical protein BWK78_00180 [Thiotrichaceae bacterium IS1]|nr:MAG: hypothetical protein BWK78_00180 [Thiotrichaceae bacterium IS1]
MTRNTICVIDIGGTNFRCGVYSSGKVEVIEKRLTPNYYTVNEEVALKREIVNMIISSFKKVNHIYPVNSLAVCFPGPVTDSGDVLGSSVIFGKTLATPFPLKNNLEEALGEDDDIVDILVTNDLTASAWRYSDRYRSFCIITVSSGIGNKIFSDGRVLVGESGIHGEIGHYSADLNDLSIPCSCGWGKNHIGMISSGRGVEIIGKHFAQPAGRYRATFLMSSFAKAIDYDETKITSELIAKFADQGDFFSQKVIGDCTKPLADAICLLAMAMYIEKFIIIGGFALNCLYYMTALKENILQRGIYNFKIADIDEMLIYGEHDDDHGLIGLGKMIEWIATPHHKQ